MATDKSKHYVNNARLIELILEYKATCKRDEKGKHIHGAGKMSEELGKCIILISRGLGQKANFNGYTWLDDMVSEGILTTCKYIHNFNPEKCDNAFAYVTRICYRAFICFIKGQKVHSAIKDKLIKSYLADGIQGVYLNDQED